jgi:hypothetical protein
MIGNGGETSMTALTLRTKRFVGIAVPKLHTVYHWVLAAIDALAEAKMRKAEHGIDWSRRLLHHGHSSATKLVRVRH